MNLDELESFKISDAVNFHDQLNPALWTENNELDPEVYDKLIEIAKDFIAELGLNSLKVDDITISGSNAAYSYTPHSDLDLHILVDYNKLPDNEVYKELFNAKKTVYNDKHDIKVHGVPVELYVQDSNQPHTSLGEYSLLKKEWNKFPVKRRANFDHASTKLKYEKLGNLIEIALKSKNLDDVNRVLDIIKRYRKAGLERTGEFGPENLAFKAIRKQGLFQKLWNLKQKLRSEELSLVEKINQEIINPNFNVEKEIELPNLGKIKLHAYYVTDRPIPRFRVDVFKVDNSKHSLDNRMGYFSFVVSDYNPDKKIFGFKVKSKKDPYVSAANASVWNEYQKKGIATAVYKFVKELGNELRPSPVQTAAGKAMWKSFQRNTDEDYHPNAKPRGPEFPPTMPMGTVRVDVSDVYDWYKLGQHISDLEGLGKHDFGKGPPSTILSFGDEDLEHKYIDALNKTGLDVTDIDPKGHEPKKGIKTDPTYNVNEILDKESAAKVYWSKENYMTDAPVSQMYTTYTAAAQDKNKNILKYNFYDFPKHDLTAIEFSRAVGPWGDNFGIDNAGDQYTVFATLVKTIEEYLSDHKPKFISFGAKEPSRAKLYQTFVNRFASKFGYKQISPDSIPKPVQSILFNRGDTPFLLQKVGSETVKESVKFIEGTNCKNCIWWKKDSEKPVGKDELNKYGGLKPPNKEYIAMSKRVDLVTLPGKDVVKEKGFCYHKDINDWVTERMCCALWDSKGVIRDYKGESPLMEENLDEASGYIPSEKEKNDPRFKTALTADVKPDSIKKNAKAFEWNISRDGRPPLLRK